MSVNSLGSRYHKLNDDVTSCLRRRLAIGNAFSSYWTDLKNAIKSEAVNISEKNMR